MLLISESLRAGQSVGSLEGIRINWVSRVRSLVESVSLAAVKLRQSLYADGELMVQTAFSPLVSSH